MAKPNPLRDATNSIVHKLGFHVESNWVNGRYRCLSLYCKPPKFAGVAERNKWKKERADSLVNANFRLYPDYCGEIQRGVFYIHAQLDNEFVPGYVAKEVHKPVVSLIDSLPPSVKDYITETLKESLDKVVAHRYVNGNEPLYVVLMQDQANLWLVGFVGKYVARRPLGPYEEATVGNARLVGWSCLYDAEPWEDSVEKFNKAKYDRFMIA